MAVLTSYSGLNGKLPAAFLLEIGGKRLLLDLGEGPEVGVRPDLSGIGRIDAIVLSHGHVDHVGAIDLWDWLGRPPVYATPETFAALPALGLRLTPSAQRHLPFQGRAEIEGLSVTLGRNGHAFGGVWVHFPQEDGALYMGDWSRESTVFAFDPPPAAELIITDISYCDRDQSLAEQIAALAEKALPGAVMPVPAMGRGAEMALRLAEAGRLVAICPQIAAEIALMTGPGIDQLLPSTAEALTAFMRQVKVVHAPEDAAPEALIVVVESHAPEAVLAQTILGTRPLVYSGHVAPSSAGASLVASGRGKRLPWNVHPRLSDQIWLAQTLTPRHLLPAFGPLEEAPELRAALKDCLTTDRLLGFGAAPSSP